MVDVQIRDSQLEVEPKGIHKLLAFKRRITVPLSSVRAVRPDPFAASGFWKGIRVPGTHIPGLIIAGTYYWRGQKTFFDVVRPERAIVIELSGASYDRIVVEVDDPFRTTEMIQKALPQA